VCSVIHFITNDELPMLQCLSSKASVIKKKKENETNMWQMTE
jgi:hypothetical protein